jgi:hypothetical protein
MGGANTGFECAVAPCLPALGRKSPAHLSKPPRLDYRLQWFIIQRGLALRKLDGYPRSKVNESRASYRKALDHVTASPRFQVRGRLAVGPRPSSQFRPCLCSSHAVGGVHQPPGSVSPFVSSHSSLFVCTIHQPDRNLLHYCLTASLVASVTSSTHASILLTTVCPLSAPPAEAPRP